MRIGTLPFLCAALVLQGACGGSEPARPPEFTHHDAGSWLNSPPLTLASLRGRVVLVEFWAFDCDNCRASLPWVESLAAGHNGAGLVVVSVHTPELPEERAPDNVREAVRRLNIRNPVMLDGDYSYWNAMHNQYWPAFYVIGRDGLIHGHAIGEMHAGDERARRLELLIEQQLAAPVS